MSNNDKALLVPQERYLRTKAEFSPTEIELIKTTICRGATNEELAYFLAVCKRTGLDPFRRQIYAIKRWDSDLRKEVLAFQTGIDGLRVIAANAGNYAGQAGPYWCGADGAWRDIWLDDDNPPHAAKVGVYRKGYPEPIWGIAKYREFVQRKKDGQPNHMWATMPANQLAKCAEAQALRKACPEETSGVELAEETSAEFVDHIIDAQPPKSRVTEAEYAVVADALDVGESLKPKAALAAQTREEVPQPRWGTDALCHRCGEIIRDWLNPDGKGRIPAATTIEQSTKVMFAPHCHDCYRAVKARRDEITAEWLIRWNEAQDAGLHLDLVLPAKPDDAKPGQRQESLLDAQERALGQLKAIVDGLPEPVEQEAMV